MLAARSAASAGSSGQDLLFELLSQAGDGIAFDEPRRFISAPAIEPAKRQPMAAANVALGSYAEIGALLHEVFPAFSDDGELRNGDGAGGDGAAPRRVSVDKNTQRAAVEDKFSDVHFWRQPVALLDSDDDEP